MTATFDLAPAVGGRLRRARRGWAAASRLLPHGGRLSDDQWHRRHRAIAAGLGLAVAAVALLGASKGLSPPHLALDTLPGAALAVLGWTMRGRRWKASLTTLGLLATGSTFVHLTGGLTEAHFAFFVIVAAITLYQDWLPFGVTVVGLTLEHAVIGLIEPDAVFGNAAAVRAPVEWALVHGAFLLAASVANIVAWKASESQALSDPLTGLPSRRSFAETLGEALRVGYPTALLLIDLSGFKRVNEIVGHRGGDRVLCEVARRIAAAVRDPDVVARFGGDEFVVLLPWSSPAGATGVAAKLVERISDPIEIDGRALRLVPVVGIALGDSGSTADTLLQAAATALHEAKRNRPLGGYEVHTAAMELDLRARTALEQDLELALELDQLVVHYQPIVEMGTGRLAGFEALLRWAHPTRGLVPPSVFIPVAEEIGLIVGMGEWVLRAATAQLARWHAAHPASADLYVSVNVSSHQLEQGGLPGTVKDALATVALGPQSLVLEITESALVGAGRSVALVELSGLGVRIALDDFGTGYSSLSYLARLPIDVLKVDKSFTDDLPGGPNEPLLAGILALAHRIGKTVVVEGVEAQDQVTSLLGLGASLGQGYLFAPPLTAADAGARLADEAGRRSSSATGQPPSALVVEDDDQLARSYTRALARAGCAAWRTSTVDEAWDILRARRTGLVLVDIGLPGADGWELVERIRADAALRETRIVVMTSRLDQAVQDKAAGTGCGYLHKSAVGGRLVAALAALPIPGPLDAEPELVLPDLAPAAPRPGSQRGDDAGAPGGNGAGGSRPRSTLAR